LGTGSNGIPNPPFTARLVRARFIVKCHEYGVNMLNIPLGGTETCPLAVGLGKDYGSRIAMNTANFADTEPVSITCTRFGTNQCSEWAIAPYSLDASPTSTGKLIKAATNPKDPEQDMGNFRFSFSIKVSIP
jgi:hypothetical protein